MEITHDSIRAAGGIVHGDGNIFFRDIGQLQGLIAEFSTGIAAWMTPDGDRVVTAQTMDGARADGGAMLSSMRPYSVPLVRASQPASAEDERAAFEAWYAERHPKPTHENSTWAHCAKVDDWEVWQARAALTLPQQPQPR